MSIDMTGLASPREVRTTCPYCGVGCGVVITTTPDGPVMRGDETHPSNYGRLCSKGSALLETISLEGRLLFPMRKTAGGYQRISWDNALDELARNWARIARDHGPDATAFYLSGQLLTEDYYVANKLMKGFVGTANVDTNSRLCMASSVAGHRRAFGADMVPGTYEDLEKADLLVLVGSNAAWCHPVLWQRMLAAREQRGTRIIVIDPRRTSTGEDADLTLQIRHGTDSLLFSGLLAALAGAGLCDETYITRHTTGFEAALRHARETTPDIATTARLTGLAPDDVALFFAQWMKCERVVTLYSQGVNQASQGTDKVGAIINCHLATARIGREGMGPFSLTGQPNAMGGREVGGLANMLAAHMGFSPPEVERVGRFWNAPRMASAEGLKAVALFDAIAADKVKALWVMATNPAVSLPRANHVCEAFAKLDFFAVSDVLLTNDTIAGEPDLLLPAHAWGEKDGTVTNSERRISRQRPFLPAPGETRADWWIVAEVAKRLGYHGFDWDGPAAVFREHAALSAFENGGERDFDLGGLAGLDDASFESLTPVQWPVRQAGDTGEKRFFAGGGYFTPDRKGRFITPAPVEAKGQPSEAYPLLLNTGRIRDQWHTMTRTGRSPRLALHLVEPFLAIHPEDAARFHLQAGHHAEVKSPYGAAILAVKLDDGLLPGTVFAPIHWSDATASHARIGALVQPFVDPFSGQPDMKATPVAVAPVTFARRGFILSRDPVTLPPGVFWARAAIPGGVATVFAAPEGTGEWLAPLVQGFADSARFDDSVRGVTRHIAFEARRLIFAAFITGAGDESSSAWLWLKAQFGEMPDSTLRKAMLAGRPASGSDPGPVICACFGIGLTAIREALRDGAGSVEEIGLKLRAGTNCGSCKPEIRRLLAAG